MRVLHINTEKTWRGGERQTLLTVVEQCRQGLESQLACRRDSRLETAAKAEKIPVIGLPAAAPAVIARLIKLAGSFDVLHCHSGRGHSLATLATLVRKRPLVATRRVDFLPRNNWFNRLKYGRANKVVCVSNYIASQMRDWGLPAENVTVIYDAVTDESAPSKDDCLRRLREKTGLPAGKRIVGNIAALVPHKDHATLLRTAQVVVAKLPNVVFVIIGEGELRDELLRLQKELGLENHVFFTGFIPQAQQLLPAFDIFAMSSCMEGLGSIVLDASLAGVPVAATAGGGLPEIVNDNQTGLLVPVGDFHALAGALLQLLSDPALASRLVKTAQDRIRLEFSVSEMARRYSEIYRETSGKPR